MSMKKDAEKDMRDYWEENIVAYGRFYDKISEENIQTNFVFKKFYENFIFPLERDGNLERYYKTVDFIKKNVKKGMVVVDLGCGTGIFTTEILRQEGYVICVDYVESALNATKQRVESLTPEYKNNVEYLLLDIMEKPLPKSDIVVCIGVTPYIHSLHRFFDHILPTTNLFYCLFLNDRNWMNRIRSQLHFLNVRNYIFHKTEEIDQLILSYNFVRSSREKLCTGFLDEIKRK